MTIDLRCPCGRKLRVQDDHAGQQGTCPACGATLDIPYPERANLEDPRVSPSRALEMESAQTQPEQENHRNGETERASDRQEPLTNHAGGALPGDADFFATPPEEIGPLLSAFTSLRQGKQPLAPAVRMLIALLVGLFGGMIGYLYVQFAGLRDGFWSAFWPMLLSAIGLALGLWLTRFKHSCSFVGRDGIARFVCSGNRAALKAPEVFLFREATELRTGQTRQFVNGVYTGTNYFFQWYDVAAKKRYSLSGTYKSKQGTPAEKDPFHFGMAAELAWSNYLLQQAKTQMQTAGTIYFGLTGGDWIRVASETLILCLKGKEIILPVADLGAVRLDQGTVVIRRKDAKDGWFSSEGVYKFPYNGLANARLFLFLLERLVGVPISG